MLARHGHVALLRLDEYAAVADLEHAALECADLHVVTGCVVLARVVRADEIREVLACAEREDECDAAEDGRGRHGGELDQEVDVDAELVDADLDKSTAKVTIRFVSEQVNVTKDASAKIVDGDPNKVVTITDVWTFARDVRSSDPNWMLVETRAS